MSYRGSPHCRLNNILPVKIVIKVVMVRSNSTHGSDFWKEEEEKIMAMI